MILVLLLLVACLEIPLECCPHHVGDPSRCLDFVRSQTWNSRSELVKCDTYTSSVDLEYNLVWESCWSAVTISVDAVSADDGRTLGCVWEYMRQVTIFPKKQQQQVGFSLDGLLATIQLSGFC
jgi:hypothetical protein